MKTRAVLNSVANMLSKLRNDDKSTDCSSTRKGSGAMVSAHPYRGRFQKILQKDFSPHIKFLDACMKY